MDIKSTSWMYKNWKHVLQKQNPLLSCKYLLSQELKVYYLGLQLIKTYFPFSKIDVDESDFWLGNNCNVKKLYCVVPTPVVFNLAEHSF